ncbi:MAG: hypothetical protein KAH01_06400 [Caldisericia bacterium]|nr:hypothetical protein [Caldisericia bacterium]
MIQGKLSTSLNGSYFNEMKCIVSEKYELKHCYFLIGQTRTVKKIFVKELKRKLKKVCEFEYVTKYGDQLTLSGLKELMLENSFFSSIKLIHVRNSYKMLNKFKKELTKDPILEYLNDHYLLLEDDVELGDVSTTIKKKLKPCEILYDANVPLNQIERWVAKIFDGYDLHPPKNIIKSLSVDYEKNLDDLFDIVKRIALEFSGCDKPYWNGAIRKFKKTTEQVIFDLSDAIIADNKAKAYATLENLVQNGKSYEEIFYYLLNHFSFLVEVKSFQEKGCTVGDILNQMKGIHPYRIKSALRSLQSIPFQKVRRGFESLFDIDIKRKKGTGIILADALVFFVENV